MTIAPLVEHALTNVLLKQFPKAKFIKSIRISAPIVVHVQMYALQRLFIRHNFMQSEDKEKLYPADAAFLY